MDCPGGARRMREKSGLIYLCAFCLATTPYRPHQSAFGCQPPPGEALGWCLHYGHCEPVTDVTGVAIRTLGTRKQGFPRQEGALARNDSPMTFPFRGRGTTKWWKRTRENPRPIILQFSLRFDVKKPKRGCSTRSETAPRRDTYFRPNFLLKRSTRPPVSTSFCLPV